MSLDSGERDESLVVLYDDMKLAFIGLMSQTQAAQVSEEAYIELTLQVSKFGYRLDQCMGLDPEKVDTRYDASQEQDRTWPSWLAHDKSKYMRTKNHIKKLLSRNKFSNSSGLFMCDCCLKKPKRFENPDDLR
jgi:hypothetical protein